ncbi:hypothetical protein UFOVP607_25 [uncultured Caudovirales phage]|uniref:Uncharacterized protein n=1 Tax=uncultured Caudovirales phage TaxID=2100421 RepID=A0A6J5N2R7_9CAUD|nr:hypothetical protein UFOVP607_25 [uncultured Caudovirales phage]
MNYTPEQLTLWFANCKPSHVGVYQVKVTVADITGFMSFATRYAYWNGREFGQVRETPEDALRFQTSKVRRPIVWRGLKEQA